tara:strand:+ start:338 stop:529 length:192 start_codon:yes stop_codon:yes gene_type:complete
MIKSYINEKNINVLDQLEMLEQICEKHSIDFDDLVKMLEAEKVKKLHRRNHYIAQVITDVVEK